MGFDFDHYTIKRLKWQRITKNRHTNLGTTFMCKLETVLGTYTILKCYKDQDCTITDYYFCRLYGTKMATNRSLKHLKEDVEEYYINALLPALETTL